MLPEVNEANPEQFQIIVSEQVYDRFTGEYQGVFVKHLPERYATIAEARDAIRRLTQGRAVRDDRFTLPPSYVERYLDGHTAFHVKRIPKHEEESR